MARKGKILKSNKRDSSFIGEIRVLGQLCTQVTHRSQLFHGTCCLMKVLVATKRFFEELGLTRVTLILGPLDLPIYIIKSYKFHSFFLTFVLSI